MLTEDRTSRQPCCRSWPVLTRQTCCGTKKFHFAYLPCQLCVNLTLTYRPFFFKPHKPQKNRISVCYCSVYSFRRRIYWYHLFCSRKIIGNTVPIFRSPQATWVKIRFFSNPTTHRPFLSNPTNHTTRSSKLVVFVPHKPHSLFSPSEILLFQANNTF